MEVKLKRESCAFQPVTIELLIESKLEWDALLELTENPRDIANHVCPLESLKMDALRRMLVMVHTTMVRN